MGIAIYRYQVESENNLKAALNKIHVWRPDSLKDLMERYHYSTPQ